MDKLLQKGREMHDGQIDYAMNQGREQGIAQGRSEGVRDTWLAAARGALSQGMSRAGVVAFTGLDAVVVDGLARELGLSAS